MIHAYAQNPKLKFTLSVNQNLECWDVTGIGSQPTNFDSTTTSWVLSRPVLGGSRPGGVPIICLYHRPVCKTIILYMQLSI